MIRILGINRLYTQILRCFGRFDFLGKGVVIDRTCDINNRIARYIHLGKGVKIAKDVWLNIPYEAPPPVKNKPIIKIGVNTVIGRRCTISGIHRIEIGPNNLFAPCVFLTDHGHEFSDIDIPIREQGVTSGVTVIIEEGCWCRHNSAVVTSQGREIRIGRNTVIGTNAVVTKSFPPHSVLVGSPARNIRLLSRNRSENSPPSAD